MWYVPYSGASSCECHRGLISHIKVSDMGFAKTAATTENNDASQTLYATLPSPKHMCRVTDTNHDVYNTIDLEAKTGRYPADILSNIAGIRRRNQYLIYSSNEPSGVVTGRALFTAVQPKRRKVNAIGASQTVAILACLGDISILQVSAPKTCHAVNSSS
jgi:hypothetical protein